MSLLSTLRPRGTINPPVDAIMAPPQVWANNVQVWLDNDAYFLQLGNAGVTRLSDAGLYGWLYKQKLTTTSSVGVNLVGNALPSTEIEIILSAVANFITNVGNYITGIDISGGSNAAPVPQQVQQNGIWRVTSPACQYAPAVEVDPDYYTLTGSGTEPIGFNGGVRFTDGSYTTPWKTFTSEQSVSEVVASGYGSTFYPPGGAGYSVEMDGGNNPGFSASLTYSGTPASDEVPALPPDCGLYFGGSINTSLCVEGNGGTVSMTGVKTQAGITASFKAAVSALGYTTHAGDDSYFTVECADDLALQDNATVSPAFTVSVDQSPLAFQENASVVTILASGASVTKNSIP